MEWAWLAGVPAVHPLSVAALGMMDPVDRLMGDVAPDDLVRLLLRRIFSLEERVLHLEDTIKQIQRERGVR